MAKQKGIYERELRSAEAMAECGRPDLAAKKERTDGDRIDAIIRNGWEVTTTSHRWEPEDVVWRVGDNQRGGWRHAHTFREAIDKAMDVEEKSK